MIRFRCPSCGTEIAVEDALCGQRGRCNSCRAEVVVPTPPANFTPVGPSPVLAPFSPSRAVPGHDPAVPTININTPRRSMGMGVSSIIFGVLAILICWVPFLNFFSVILGGIGLFVAGIGVLVALSRRGVDFMPCFVGLVLNGLAFLVSFGMLSALADVGRKAQESPKSSPAALSLPNETAPTAPKADSKPYLERYVTLTGFEQVAGQDFLGKPTHGVKGMIKNNGTKTITKLIFTAYFYDSANKICGEYGGNLIGFDKEPLKPNYSMELSADLSDHIPPTWSGALVGLLTDCEFAE